MGADLVKLIHGAHDVTGPVAHAVHGVEAVEYLAVVHLYLELGNAKLCKGVVDDGGDLRLVYDVQLAVADDVYIGLVELTEAAALGALTAVDLAYLVAAEGEAELGIVAGHVLCKGHGQIKTQGQVAVALHEAVNLLFGLAAALGKQHLGRLNNGSVQRSKAVYRIALAEYLHHALHLNLLLGQQLHKAGQSPGLNFCHSSFPFK